MACSCGKETCACGSHSILYLQDEAGQAHPFYIGETFTVNNRQYVLLQSAEDAEQMAMVKVVYDDDGRPSFRNIEDDDEWSEIERALATATP
jgi:uncharacterized protein YrzB (UPF0473 family)